MIGQLEHSVQAHSLYSSVPKNSPAFYDQRQSTLAEKPESDSSNRAPYSTIATKSSDSLGRNHAAGAEADQASGSSSSEESAQQKIQVEQVIQQLKARDSEVKAHEMAHLAAAGNYSTGGMNFTYQTGPDGRKYAVGGEVGIDTSPVAGNPQATLEKAMVIQRAALAPAEPSAQDRNVASAASQMMAQARADLRAEARQADETSGTQESESSNTDATRADDNRALNQGVLPLQKEEGALIDKSPARYQFDLRMQLAGNSLTTAGR